MRKTIISAVAVAAALTLAACGGSDDNGGGAGDDATSSSEETPAGEDTPAAEDEGGGEEGGGTVSDLSAALLTAEDLPEGAQIQPFDVSAFSAGAAGMAELLEDIVYEPADCADTEGTANPLAREGVEAVGMTAATGEAMAADVLVNAVYSGASTDDIDAAADYANRCPSVNVTGTTAGQAIDMTVSNSVVEGLDIDADAAIALNATIESGAVPVPPTRVIYVVDGDYGVMLSANPESEHYDLDALVQIALDKLRAAQN